MRTLEQIASDPQAGDVVMNDGIAYHVAGVYHAGIQAEAVWSLGSSLHYYSKDQWAELCRSAKLPGGVDE